LNSNFKIFELNNDKIRIQNFYKAQGYNDVYVDYNVEYFIDNKVEINFIISEGQQYFISAFQIKNNLDTSTDLNNKIDIFLDNNKHIINVSDLFVFDWKN
jgi:outer membrane protein assembly factor BamA